MKLHTLRYMLFCIIIALFAALGCVEAEHTTPFTSTPKVDAVDEVEEGKSVSNKEQPTSTPEIKPAPTERQECKPEVIKNAKVAGRLWLDEHSRATTEISQGVDPTSEALKGIVGQKVTLTLPNGKVLETTTCDNGWFSFPQVTEKIGILNFHRKDCTTNNCPTNTAKYAQKRRVKIVTFGDSIPSYPKKFTKNPPIWYPERLQRLSADVVEIENVNVAKPGTQTKDWLPETDLFQQRLAPHANDTDVYLFSIGGNDVLALMTAVVVPGLLYSVITSKIKATVDRAISQARTTIDKIREQSPDADIVFTSYLNYSRTFLSLKTILIPDRQRIVRGLLHEALQRHIKELAGYKGAMVVDINGFTEIQDENGQPFRNEDLLIFDGIHLNEKGHIFYSKRVFNTLGGFIEEDDGSVIGGRHYVGYPTPK